MENSLLHRLWNVFTGNNIVLNLAGLEQPLIQSKKQEDNKISNAAEFSLNLNKIMLHLYSTFLSEDGKYVDYLGISKSKEFEEFLETILHLPEINVNDLSGEERMAFFLNMYNVIVIHGYIIYGVPTSTTKRTTFFQKMSYQIGDQIYSLDDIEHGILRGNRKHPAFFIRNPQFGKTDPRIKYSVTQVDPRIHFALVCGAQSCPPVRLYSSSNLDRGLQLAAAVFCNDDANFKLDIEKKEIGLSQIFQWYLGDFGHTVQELIHWIVSFLNEEKKKQNWQIS